MKNGPRFLLLPSYPPLAARRCLAGREGVGRGRVVGSAEMNCEFNAVIAPAIALSMGILDSNGEQLQAPTPDSFFSFYLQEWESGAWVIRGRSGEGARAA